MNKKICLLPGDGIGPEILAEGRKVLGSRRRQDRLHLHF